LAHFAQLNEENIVTQVIVVANQDTADQDGVESEAVGIAFCTSLLGGNWKQTSYNGNIRKNYAGIGYKYDATLDAFIPPQPFASWTLDEALEEWLDKQFTKFGRWSLRSIGAIALAALVYMWAMSHGWSIK